ncbi:hypothetical protein CPAR01_03659 [Colletotrichum paranaense]|uniref:Uncharacterized protein n=1 Tax=Colletotrichum paranaense TaxID=1914294 RepID=A0ABQ9SU31_9PEZI|nr:uncharacterized protein CPAR01_03659 [Colletotrichum paranaense]KAK1543026.1 hypothetical protein CPAR01_03659 [Colletotrichum paranaense]
MPLAHSEHPMARRAGGAAVQLPFFLQQNLARTGLDLQRRYSPARFIPHRRDAARDAVKDRPAPFHVGSQPTNASSRGNRLGYRFCLPFDTDCLLSTLPVVLSCPSSDVYTTPVTIQHGSPASQPSALSPPYGFTFLPYIPVSWPSDPSDIFSNVRMKR